MRNRAPRYKVGQKVILLPSAVKDGIFKSEIGKIAEITNIDKYSYFYNIETNFASWVVNECNIVPAIVIGQQLLLWEDLWDIN